MILCVDRSKIDVEPYVQRKVDLEDIMLNCTKYFNDTTEALKHGYVPLDFSTSVRTVHSNLVLQHDVDEGEVRYYTNLSSIPEHVHKGYDLIMFLSSLALMFRVDYKAGFDELMVKNSQFHPIGIYNPDPDVFNPIVYSYVVLKDDCVEEFSKYLKDNSRLVPIQSIKNPTEDRFVVDSNIKALIDTLILIKPKEENEDEQHNND